MKLNWLKRIGQNNECVSSVLGSGVSSVLGSGVSSVLDSGVSSILDSGVSSILGSGVYPQIVFAKIQVTLHAITCRP